MEAMTAAGLATLAGVSEAEIARLTDLGVLVPRDGPAPCRAGDLRKVRLAMACERAGLPMDGIAAAIRAGRLSFAFLEAAPYHRFGVPTDRTYRQVSQDTGISLEVLRDSLEAMGFAWTSADDPVRDDELEAIPLLDRAVTSGVLDRRWMTRVGRAYTEGMRLAARVENEAYRARFEEPVLASGLGQREAMEQASALAARFVPLIERALVAIYRRQQDLLWIEHQVLNIEAALEPRGPMSGPKGGRPCFLDLAGSSPAHRGTGRSGRAELAGAWPAGRADRPGPRRAPP